MRTTIEPSIRALFIVSLLVSIAGGSPAVAKDWPVWRGPAGNGMVYEKAVVTKWSPSGENLLWKSPEGGRTTPLIMNGRVFFIGPVGDGECLQERVICLDADTGKTLWDHHFNVFFSDIAAQRVGWTSLAGDPETGNVYAHGTGGEMLCFDRDGKLLWKHSLTEEYNRVSGYGGRLVNPAIDEDRVIISFLSSNWGNHAKPAHRFVAFDKRTGKVIWWAQSELPPTDTSYACPIAAVVNGQRQLICPAGDGVIYGFEARTGRALWNFRLTKMGCNSSPVVDGNHLYISHSEENLDNTTMGRLVCIDISKTGDITKSGEVWRLDGLDAGYASPALANGRIYHVDNSANLHCIDAKTGKPAWQFKLGRVGKGSPTVTSDGVIYVGEQNGVFWILKDAGDHADVLSKVEFPGPNNTIDEIYGSPAICGGRVYFMTRYGTYCLGIKGQTPAEEPIPKLAAERSAAGQKPTTMLVIPGDVSLTPGGSEHFDVRLFGENGARLEGPTPKVEWSVAGVKGELKEGTLTAAPQPVFSAGLLTAKVGSLTAVARVRVAPKLPIYETFEQMTEGAPPPGWTGVMGKTKVVARDGGKVFQKIAEKGKPSPVWKMRAYIGEPVAGGYTVQADVLGTQARRFKPDMGIINTRYEMIMQGQIKELELSRWRDEPVHSLRKKIPFEMKPDLWYRMKLRVELKGDQAMVQGKVWPRDDQEPEAWTIEYKDPCANLEGCPGLFAYSNGTTDKSNGAEVFYDNIKVNANE